MGTDKNIKPNQHYVPRFYLRPFATPETRGNKNPSVWVSSNRDSDKGPFKRSIKKCAVEKNIYSPENTNKQRSSKADSLLTDVEAFISRVWPNFTNKNVEFIPFKRTLSIFISTLFRRNIKRFAEMKTFREEYLLLLESLPKDVNGNPLIENVQINDNIYEIDRESFNDYKNPPYDIIQEMFVDSIFSQTFKLVDVLDNKRWTILMSDQKSFITTDSPVAFFHKEKDSYGYNTYGTEFILPLSPARLLLIHDNKSLVDGGYYSVTSEDKAIFYNYISWYNSYRFMFAHRNPVEVLNEFDMYGF